MKEARKMIKRNKVAIVGAGFVGSSAAFALMSKGTAREIVLIDVNEQRAQGEAMDLAHGLPYAGHMVIRSGHYEDAKDAGLIIITAGASQKPGQTRLDLIKTNAKIMTGIVNEIVKVGFEGMLLIVSNPVDVLTHVALKVSGYSKERVFGSGTVLDTARLKYLLSKKLNVDTRNIHAVIIGEHGDSELAPWSFANISGVPIEDFEEVRGIHDHEALHDEIIDDVRNSAYAIIERKGATYYGIAFSIARIVECILKNEHTMLPISVELNGEYGLEGLALSVPAILGENGVEAVLEVPLSAKEKREIKASASALKEVISQLEME